MHKLGIDFHTHPVLVREIVNKYPELVRAARETYYIGNNFQPLETFLLELDLAGLEKAVILPMASASGPGVSPNEQIAELCAMSPRLIGFASVDPHRKDAPAILRHAIKDLGLRGLKLNPPMQEFYAYDKLAYPLYETALDLGIPILFHAGMSWEPGRKMQYGQPRRFENVAADFPKLNIVLAHLAWPWVTEAVA